MITDDGDIRALTPEVVAQIEWGEGASLALPVERNGVPGPRHVLDLADDLKLSADQRTKVRAIYDAMTSAAILAGQRYLAAERALEAEFRAGTLSTGQLPARMSEVSRLQGELAAIHLAAHLQTAEVLTRDQVAAYDWWRASE